MSCKEGKNGDKRNIRGNRIWVAQSEEKRQERTKGLELRVQEKRMAGKIRKFNVHWDSKRLERWGILEKSRSGCKIRAAARA